jgi:hypothetical protein
MNHIAQSPLAAKPLDGLGDLFINRPPSTPRSLGGRWIARRYSLPAATADLLGELIGLGPEGRP